MRCEDYPCCGHTDGLPCDWTAPDYSRDPHFMCDHAAGVCDVYEDDTHELDEDDTDVYGLAWCYGCDAYTAPGCPLYEEPDGAPAYQWEVTTPSEVYMTDQGYEDRGYEDALLRDW